MIYQELKKTFQRPFSVLCCANIPPYTAIHRCVRGVRGSSADLAFLQLCVLLISLLIASLLSQEGVRKGIRHIPTAFHEFYSHTPTYHTSHTAHTHTIISHKHHHIRQLLSNHIRSNSHSPNKSVSSNAHPPIYRPFHTPPQGIIKSPHSPQSTLI